MTKVFKRFLPCFSKEEIKEKLKMDVSYMKHPIPMMRKGYITKGIIPEEFMFNWLSGTQPEGFKRQPIPDISNEYKDLYNKFVSLRDNATEKEIKHNIHIMVNTVVIESISDTWWEPKALTIKWPDVFTLKDMGTDSIFYAYIFDSYSQDSYRIIYGDI